MVAVSFFNQPYLADKVEVGKEIAVTEMEQAKQQLMGMKVVAQVDDGLEPVYHLAAGMKQSQLVKVIHQVLNQTSIRIT